MTPPLPRLCLITDLARLGEERLLGVIEAAGRGGLRFLQVREKDLPAEDVARLVARCRAALPAGALVVANGTVRPPGFAREAGADGCHVGGGDLELVAAVRRELGPGAPVGYSAHAAGEIDEAARRGASHVFLAPVFAPLSKAGGPPPLGIGGLADACRHAAVPVYALGGITAERAASTAAAGAWGAAVMGAVLDAADPEAAAREILTAIESGGAVSFPPGG
jgi:thiamine-phosphate pyrophosphorylase